MAQNRAGFGGESGEEVGDRGALRVGAEVGVEGGEGGEDEVALREAGVREGEGVALVGEALAALEEEEEVEVDGARGPAMEALAAEALLLGEEGGEGEFGGEVGVELEDGVEERETRRAKGAGLKDR